MARHGKKYQDAAKLVDRERVYPPLEACELARTTSFVAFDASIEAHLRLGVDPRHADQMVRGTVVLPHGTGKIVRVAVFAQGEKAQEALRAGADEVGGEDLVKKIEAGWLEFDVAIATPDSMGLVGRLGKILGRRGLMPNPKAGTITFDIERAVSEVKGGRVEFRVDKTAIVHAPFGEQLRARAAARQPRRPRRRDQPRQADGREGPVPEVAHDRQHDGPGHPGRRARRPRRRCGIIPVRPVHRATVVTAERRVTDPYRPTRPRQPASAGR
jgi:large subunit ribosomal protein L1